ncbi:MAG: hypothetical protein ACYDIA_23835 [Candidatus Humimicrobiaceae bacterium]
MAGYDLNITISPENHLDAKKFLEFLKNVGKKYPVTIRYKTLARGYYYITIDGTPGAKINALFQELILNKGLYYYSCTINASDREKTISNVISPIYKAIVEERFDNPYSRFLIRHIKGKLPQNKFIPGELLDPFSSKYEIIFRRWDIGSLTDWDFIVGVVAFLNRFLLVVIGHKEGDKSLKFDALCKEASRVGIALNKETIKIFSTFHRARTYGLHRLKELLKKEEIEKYAADIYWYFEYYDEFKDSQIEKMEKLHGKRYKKIRYGSERFIDENGELYKDENGKSIEWEKEAKKRPCHDCYVNYGQIHVSGCDIEQCPRCGGQRLGCGCKLDEDN